ncbi:hypothetical protein [Geminisphaera colitermitum]|uniref:hypothetical protein n=1 Tax=Geminisphaera colitermitum TaxID=1148786 RepID=UPI0001964DE3|nr:hypothetical protein [Geminisphaera colitermitum]
MITKLDRAVVRYCHLLKSAPPDEDHGWVAWMDKLDRARFDVLNLLFKRQRYRRMRCRKAWVNKANPHRPPLA